MKNIILLLLGSFFLLSCSNLNDTDNLVVATSADNPPYEYVRRGTIEGFDIDLIKEIGRRLDKSVTIKNMDFHGLLAALASHNVDLVIAGMSITEERKSKVDFSIPYLTTKVNFLVRKDSNITKLQDLNSKKVGSQLGTTWSMIAATLASEHGFKNKTLASNLMLVEELKLGRIDALILEEFQARKFVQKNHDLINFSVNNGSALSIAIPKKSQLKKPLDQAIQDIKNDGTLDQLKKKWGID